DLCQPARGETVRSRPADCHGTCGNSICEWRDGENYDNCSDCECPTPRECMDLVGGGELCSSGCCGNGACDCDVGETHAYCPEDCDGTEAGHLPHCGTDGRGDPEHRRQTGFDEPAEN